MTGVEQIRKYTTAIAENERNKNAHISDFINNKEITVVKINKAGIKFSFSKSDTFTFTTNKRSKLNNTRLNTITPLFSVQSKNINVVIDNKNFIPEFISLIGFP